MTQKLRRTDKRTVTRGTVSRPRIRAAPQISLLTDFGHDDAVYAVKSAIRYANPKARVEDICHTVPLGNILIGATRLRRAATLPTEREGTVYVAVVDPGVGTERRSIIVQTRKGKYLVGPDNAVLSLAFLEEGIENAVEIENPLLTLLHFAHSKTFHGKDIFAPAAAYLAKGVPIGEFGEKIEPKDLARINISAQSTDRTRRGYVVDIDGCGAIRTTVPNHLPRDAIGKKIAFLIESIDGPLKIGDSARVVRAFGDAKPGEKVLVLSSTGNLDIAVTDGNASQALFLGPGTIGLDGELRPRLAISIHLDQAGDTCSRQVSVRNLFRKLLADIGYGRQMI